MKWHRQAAVGSKKELLAGLLIRGNTGNGVVAIEVYLVH
jgi:hypothetical protein